MGNKFKSKQQTTKMQRANQAGQMRLQREAKMAKRDIETQIKKTGKINDGFICLPDPEDAFVWYYIVYGLETKDYEGGYYMGKIICPPEYPAKAPKVIVLTENGRFHTWDEGICLSISDYHPESWNPVWKVNQIVVGLVSFWQQHDEYTYGAVEDGELSLKNGESTADKRIDLAKKSREAVMKHAKWSLFEPYAKAIGIDQIPELDSWKAHEKKWAESEAKLAEERRLAEEKKRAEEEAAKAAEQAQMELEKAKAVEKMKIDYFKLINQMGLAHGQKRQIGQQRKAGAA